MDPRYRRSRVALRHAVYRLAEQRPITEVTVTELCREAGVTRDTFYRHAGAPLDLLADVLREDLEAIAGDHPDLSGGFGAGAGMRAGVRALCEHVAGHAGVYRNAARPHLLGPLRDVLETVVRRSLEAHADAHPEILPPEARAPEDVRVLAAYAAAGTVGALEVWLELDPLSVQRGERLIVAGSPAFWHGPPA
ncbi:TetR/AcrR family transcriptional regulator [Symbioplanes lichenis]|uniref:TetR/AcrR family transcriptional regulator n=1 Tax=Symbioplanes lichenis TaxID=1629072 RepID=UPI00273938CB|nr:TetR/AcrR family transcriptional regulator [Actinoplanes lichenis]